MRTAIELAVCAAVVTVISIYALWRMDLLSPDTQHHIRLTDNSRSAYVAKNIADGNGYTTNDLPAALIDFYDDRGKLHDERWTNADRFPFTAYAIAALYKVTGTTSYEVGILVYNLIAFVAFLVVLYRFAHTVWGDRYSALLVIAVAMLHQYTYFYLYWKDGDMLLLTTASMAALYRYAADPPGSLGWKRALWMGTVLAWLFFVRPNLGGAFVVGFAAIALARLWRQRRADLRDAFVAMVRREGIVAVAFVAWCVPFVIHSMQEWGTPFFSANGIYQLPLGTRYGMGTDTWWKYTDPSQTTSFAGLWRDAGDQMLAKLTTSWLTTLKHVVRSYAIELFLACGLLLWLRARRRDEAPDRVDAPRPLRTVALVVAFALVLNLALLPLYSYQDFSWRHYIGFGLPLLWLGAGRAVVLLVEAMSPMFDRAREHLRAHAGVWIAIIGVGVLAWNFGSKGSDANALFVRTSDFIGAHWLMSSLLLLALLAHRWILRRPAYPRIVAVVAILVFARVLPHRGIKSYALALFPADEKVWDVLQERRGIVSSLALQGEVAWTSDRKNIPAPEYVMHLYSYRFDHRLDVEDVYIESAKASLDGPFSGFAPGFDGYVRLQRFRGRLPGYELVFHTTANRGYPTYKIKPIEKASSVYRLVDRAAVEAMRRSPDRIELGAPADLVHTAYGFDAYYTLDGKPVVAATDITRKRFRGAREAPWQDSGVTFFLDDRRPRAVELEFYAPAPNEFEFYWNVDLYHYDRASERRAKLVGTYTAAAPGWQRVRLDVPAGVTRAGLNVLGWRSAASPFVVCSVEATDSGCLAQRPVDPSYDPNQPPQALRIAGATGAIYARVSMLAGTLTFHY